ncbi:MAG: 50S ribosomal protein L27, partial [Anaerolineae bacterium]
EHGILTFAQLAETPVETLQAILDEANFRLGDPGTWAEQAALAARGEWDALQTLQDSLKGGRRVD